MTKRSVFFSFFILLTIAALPLQTFAQYRYSSEWQREWEGSEKDRIDEWRARSSSLRNKINDLDENKVENLPVPVLFGITPANISRNFGDPRSGGRTHEGLDIMAPKGAPVVTPTEAVVLRTGTGESSGLYVYTANPGEETFVYMHLDSIADIEEGDALSVGELIGYVGNTGNASGGAPHLHFEIHQDGNPIDPFPRLTRIFPLKDKIEYLNNILDEADDEDKLAESLVILYRNEFVLAQTYSIALPASVVKAMANKIAGGTTAFTRTLRVGLRGEDVKLLQTILGISADGSFGPKTKAAVVAFQISKGLAADGVVGPITRAALGGGGSVYREGCTSSTIYSPTTGIKC